MKVTGTAPRPRSLGACSPYSALSGTQRTRQRKARASQYIISNAETLQSNFTLFATALPYAAFAAPLGESLGVRGATLADRVLSPAHRMVTPSPSCPERQTFREQAARQLPPSAVSSECPDSVLNAPTQSRARPRRPPRPGPAWSSSILFAALRAQRGDAAPPAIQSTSPRYQKVARNGHNKPFINPNPGCR